MRNLLIWSTVLPILVTMGMPWALADNDFIVYSPYVVRGQGEIETKGFESQDGRSDLNGANGYDVSVAYSVADWWRPELYVAQFNREPGGTTQLSGYEFENTFQLTSQGEYWADLGFIASYAHAKLPDIVSTVELGPLLEKRLGRTDQRLNLIWEKQVGGGAGGQYQFRSAYSFSYWIVDQFAPGFEVYYRPNDNANQIGPVVYGEFHYGGKSEFEYSVGVVYGLNALAPSRTFVARLEYEFY